MNWPEWFFRQADPSILAVPLLIVFAVLMSWGVLLMIGALRRQRLHLRREFDFWLGAFMSADSTLYLLLVINVLRDGEGADLWTVLYFIAVALPAGIAFWRWSRAS